MIATLLAGLIIFSCFYSHAVDTWYWHDYKTVEEMAIYCDTPDKLVTWARGHITTDKFKKYEWPDIYQVLWTQEGDCKAYAVLYYAVLKSQGYTPHIICVWEKEKGHAVCVCRIDGDYCVLDKKGISKTLACDIPEVLRFTYKNFDYWYEKGL